MKIRNGFVSNSSSSSFVLIGKSINISELTTKHVKDTTYIEAKDLYGEGVDIFVLSNRKILDFIKRFGSNFVNAYIDAREVECDRPEIIDSDVGKSIYAFERTQHYSKSVEDLKENYGKDDSENS